MSILTISNGKNGQPAAEERVSIAQVSDRLNECLALGDAGVVLAVDMILSQGVRHGVSDIYFEPWLNNLGIRYRMDGALTEIATIPKSRQEQMLARLKILARLAVYQREIPQDGRIDADASRDGRSMRVSTIPTIHGEKAVVRIMDPARTLLPLHALGFDAHIATLLPELVGLPQGALLLTGPSSSGKTTTIYSLLREMLSPSPSRRARHIVTLEDPVEYQIEGATQMQVTAQHGPGFESLFKSVLRQDPDVIVIGEIRDSATARTTIQAGLTGHLVISTIHSGSAAGVFSRLLDMGIEPFLIASAIRAVLAQRLVRRICAECSVPSEVDTRLLELYGFDSSVQTLRRGAGCDACNNLGYRGRTAFGELLLVTDEFSDLVLERSKLSTLQRAAEKSGMKSLCVAGREKVLASETTIDELRAVLAPELLETRPS